MKQPKSRPATPLLRVCGLLALGGCLGPNYAVDPGEALCDPRELAPGELRVKRIACNEERINGGEGLTGDWLVENAQSRFVIRHGTALTLLGVAGGSIIDATRQSGRDAVWEAMPRFDVLDENEPPALISAEITPFEEAGAVGVEVWGERADGAWDGFAWRLEADRPDIALLPLGDGPLLLDLLPLARSEPVGAVLEIDPDEDGVVETLLAVQGSPLDPPEAPLGRRLYADVTGLVVGSRAAVAGALWPDGLQINGLSDGAWVEARDAEGQRIARLLVEGYRYGGRVPAQTAALVAVRPGWRDGDPVAPDTDRRVALGPQGGLRLQVSDDRGAPAGHGLLGGAGLAGRARRRLRALAPGNGELVVGAGPAHGQRRLPHFQVLAAPELSLQLDRVQPQTSTLAEIGLRVAPDPDVALSPSQALSAAVSRGSRVVVTVARDEVAAATLPLDLSPWVVAWGGTEAARDDGAAVWAWPYAAATRRPAHGALPWPELDPLELLGQANQGGRSSVVDADWVRAAGPPWTWTAQPFALRLSGLQDLPTLFGLLDAGLALRLVGPLTWLEQRDAEGMNAVQAQRALLEGPTTAGNGLRITLSARALPESSGRAAITVRASCSGPAWMPPDAMQLWGPGGVLLAEIPAQDPRPPQIVADLSMPAVAWVVASCEGLAAPPAQPQPLWAVSSPRWAQAP